MSLKHDIKPRDHVEPGAEEKRRYPALTSFVRFGGLSGLGWLIDFGLLLLLVKSFGMLPLAANLVSATTAAVLVFLISRKVVFAAQAHAVLTRTLIYGAYTVVVILLASVAMKYVADGAWLAARHYSRPMTPTLAAGLAKVVVTPLNFILNFFAAKVTSEHVILA